MKTFLFISILFNCFFCTGQVKKNTMSSQLHFYKNDQDVIVMKNYHSINSVKKLTSYFKGRPILLDLWATWCTTCINDFSNSDSIYNLLARKKVQLVYVSMDQNEKDTTWQRILHLKKLKGYHVRASKNLQDDLTLLIWGAKDVMSIPHYLIFDKFGKLSERNAFPSVSGLELINSISKKFEN